MLLEQIIADEGPLDLARAVALTEAVAAALDRAHGQGLISGDLRPSTVVVDAEGSASLTDLRPGTGRRADIVGLAALAFVLLTGRAAHPDEEPPEAHELRPAVPPAASETVRRGLAGEPGTAGAFAAELRAAAGMGHSDPVLLAPSPARRRLVGRVVAGAVAAVLAALAGLSLAGVLAGGSAPQDRPDAAAGR